MFGSIQDENRYLQNWEVTVADTRTHGTTKRRVGRMFQEVEKSALLPLPAGRFPFFHEGQRSGGRTRPANLRGRGQGRRSSVGPAAGTRESLVAG
jgi:hypothetical protein